MNRKMSGMRFTVFSCFVLLVAGGLAQEPNPEVTVSALPEVPLIEHRDHEQLLNFDLTVSNHGKSTLRLSEIELSVFDSAGRLVVRKTVNSDGLAPGVEIVAQPLLTSGGTMDIFNPFYSFSDEVPIHHMQYVFRYLREDNEEERAKNRHRLPMDHDLEVGTMVTPRDYRDKTNLILPLSGRVFIWEGHDFYAHHRRVPLHAANVQKLGIHANANRYGSDMVIIDEQGRMYHDDPYNKRDWYAYGAPIYAPGAGKVVSSANNVPDNEFQGKHITTPEFPAGTDPDLGNYVLIDHGNGEFSIFPHMMPGSVRARAGQTVRQGETIGQVGFSGDAIFPHVHYSLLAGPDIYRFEGLPAYFTQFWRLLSSKSVSVEQGTVDSGDIVESTAKYQPAP
jgi:murein DD-endopeptidase MepM/ murein hydrolase activator NlpD